MKPFTIRTLCVAALAAMLAATASAHENSHPAKNAKAAVSAEEHPFGMEGEAGNVTRTITVDMRDTMRFTPSQISVRQGETIRFIVRNKGRAMHEMVLGTADQLKAHGELMKQHPGMEHAEPYMAHVRPGGEESIIWKFTRAGDFVFGCLAPGHFEAGMTGKLTVSKR